MTTQPGFGTPNDWGNTAPRITPHVDHERPELKPYDYMTDGQIRVTSAGDALTTARAGWDGVLPRGVVEVAVGDGQCCAVPRENLYAAERRSRPKHEYPKRKYERAQRQVATYECVCANPGISVRECAHRVDCEQSTVAGYLKDMETARLITRIRPPQTGLYREPDKWYSAA